jgi:hypothetical protein
MGNQDAIERITVVTWKLGRGLQQSRADVKQAKLAGKDGAEIPWRSQSSGLPLDGRFPYRHRTETPIDRRIDQDRPLSLRQLIGITQRPKRDGRVDQDDAHS